MSNVPESAETIAFLGLTETSGRDYAYLTGDFNPIHWIPPAARASGFPNVLLHGFGQMALASEDLIRSSSGGSVREMDVKFISSVVLPTEIAVSVDKSHLAGAEGGRLFVSSCKDGALHMVGTYVLAPTVTAQSRI